jgi:hypothetical protein
MWTRALLLGALVASSSGVVGCAQERPPINRVQADALAKSFFVGADLKDISDDPEFYMRGTVVDVGYGAAQDGLFTSTYAQPISRIRWEVTEDTLNARLAYERIQTTDSKGEQHDGWVKKATNDGQIVASYKIRSHFDIRRAYNPTTGEEQNIVEENSSDRPWYQREYFRVDWSQNLATDAYDFDTLSMMGLFGSIEYEPLSYTVLDPNDPDAPHFDAEAGYFDVTNKAFAKPAVIDLSSLGWGIDKFPACMLPGEFAGGTQPYGNCNPVEITLRQSFRKVVDTDYEAFDMDGVRFQAYGNFITEYHGYERNYGIVDDKWWHFADRYNIWERSHFYTDYDKMTGAIECDKRDANADPTLDPNRDDNKNGTADECESAGAGSKCDVFKGKCTLPFRDRIAKGYVKTIPWYINGGSTTQIDSLKAQIAANPDDANLKAALDQAQKDGENLFEATDWAVQEWDLAMKTAVRTAALVECRRTGGSNCDTDFPMWTGQQDDNDEAVAISRDLNRCRRENGWTAQKCDDDAKAAAATLAGQRGNASDAGTLAIGDVVSMPAVIVLCHNPVIKGDHPACGDEGLSPRLGDIRYNTVLNIDKPQQPSAWGIMVDADDPITGEKVAASINIWTHVTDIASQSLVDLVRYMNGELQTTDITNGTYVRDWVRAQSVAGGLAGSGPTMSKHEIQKRLAAAAKVDTKTYADVTKNGTPAAVTNILAKAKERVADVAIDNRYASPAMLATQARMKQARGTDVETQLLNKPMLQLAGVDKNVPVQGAFLDAASPLALNNPKIRHMLSQMRENALAARGACIINEAPEASSLTGIAAALKRKFPIPKNESAVDRQKRYENMINYVRRKYHYAVLAHEMGHSIGLRHNFVSTYASLFYRPQYWQLRTKNGTVTQECTDAVADGSTCVGPRYFDPVTDEEQSQLIWMFMQSTVMDYPGDVSQDTIGLGAYDFGAARFFYGDVASVYTDSSYKAGSKIGVGVALATDDFGGLAGIAYGLKDTQFSNSTGAANFHYSQLQTNYKVIQNCYEVTPTQPATWDETRDGKWDPVIDGKIVSVAEKGGAPKAKKCRQQLVDYVSYGDLRMPDPAKELNKSPNYRGGPNVDPKGRLRVPYAFASDNWADTGNVSVFRHDNGADPYEQVQFLITTQENRHILDNYRRNRTTFNVRAAADRSYSRYNEKMLGIAGGIGFYRTIYQDIATESGFSIETLWPLLLDGNLKDNVIGASVAFDHFTRELSRPEPGSHYYKDPTFNDPVLHSDSDADDFGAGSDDSPFGGNHSSNSLVLIPNGATGYLADVGFGGHPLENALATDKGDWDVDYTQNAGAYYDKIHTAILLSESEDRFISQSRRDFYDARFRAVGMADVFPEGYRRVLANALTNDRSVLAPHVEATPATPSGTKPWTAPVPVLDTNSTDTRDPNAKQYPARPIGWTSWWPSEGPSVCFPTDGKNVCNDYLGGTGGFNPDALDNDHMAAVDPQVGFEVQKFLIAWTLSHIPANQKTNWVDMMRIYRLKTGTLPEFDNRIEWQDPQSGETYYARTYGMECLFGDATATTKAACTAAGGKWVQKGIGARVLEYANFLTGNGYELDKTNYAGTADYPAGYDAHGRARFLSFGDGTPVVAVDQAVKDLNASGTAFVLPSACLPDPANGNQPLNGCTPLTTYKNHYANELIGYKTIADFLNEVAYMYFDVHTLGEFP